MLLVANEAPTDALAPTAMPPDPASISLWSMA